MLKGGEEEEEANADAESSTGGEKYSIDILHQRSYLGHQFLLRRLPRLLPRQ